MYDKTQTSNLSDVSQVLKIYVALYIVFLKSYVSTLTSLTSIAGREKTYAYL